MTLPRLKENPNQPTFFDLIVVRYGEQGAEKETIGRVTQQRAGVALLGSLEGMWYLVEWEELRMPIWRPERGIQQTKCCFWIHESESMLTAKLIDRTYTNTPRESGRRRKASKEDDDVA